MDPTATKKPEIDHIHTPGNTMLIRHLPTTYTPRGSVEAAEADYCGKTYTARSKSGALCALARTLLEAGCPDAPWTAKRGDLETLHGPSLMELAKWTYSDTDKGLRRVKWVAFPDEMAA